MIITKICIRPTNHFIEHHSDVSWELVIKTILSPDKVNLNKRKGKDRFTYVKYFKKHLMEVHVKKDEVNNEIWVINAFKMRR